MFFSKEMYGRFAGPKKSGCKNEVAVMRGSMVVRGSGSWTGRHSELGAQW